MGAFHCPWFISHLCPVSNLFSIWIWISWLKNDFNLHLAVNFFQHASFCFCLTTVFTLRFMCMSSSLTRSNINTFMMFSLLHALVETFAVCTLTFLFTTTTNMHQHSKWKKLIIDDWWLMIGHQCFRTNKVRFKTDVLNSQLLTG